MYVLIFVDFFVIFVIVFRFLYIRIIRLVFWGFTERASKIRKYNETRIIRNDF